MNPDKLTGDNIVDDVEMEAFVDWLYTHGHVPFSMSKEQLQWVWFKGMIEYHKSRLLRPSSNSGHASGLRHCMDQASTLPEP